MAKKHRWDKSGRGVWPMACLDCGCTGRIKAGTAGTMQYQPKGETAWRPRHPCETPRGNGFVASPARVGPTGFSCCGGTDEPVPQCTQDCETRTP